MLLILGAAAAINAVGLYFFSSERPASREITDQSILMNSVDCQDCIATVETVAGAVLAGFQGLGVFAAGVYVNSMQQPLIAPSASKKLIDTKFEIAQQSDLEPILRSAKLVAKTSGNTIIYTTLGEIYFTSQLNLSSIIHRNHNHTFSIYLNNMHASIRLENGEHYGFNPKINSVVKLFSLFAQIPMKYDFPFSFLPCEVTDDWEHGSSIEVGDGVKVDFYINKDQAEHLRDFVLKEKEQCSLGKNTYHILHRNCIHFAQRALRSISSNSDFLDAIPRQKLFEHAGLATLYAALHSNGPIEISLPST